MAALVLATGLRPQPPVHVEVPDIDIPEIDIEIPDLPAMLAEADEDRDNDEADDEEHDEKGDKSGLHVYKMTPPKFHFPRVHIGNGWDHDSWDEESWDGATAQAKGDGSATLPVKGPITFQLRAQGGDVEVSTAAGSRVVVTVDGKSEEVALYAFGDRVQPSFRGRRMLRHGKVRVELPVGSRLDLTTMSGDVTAQNLAEARIRSLSGDVKVVGVDKADVGTVSGDVHIANARGQVRLHTVSGHAVIESTGGSAPQIEFQSTSGDMDWSGACAKDCHLSAETMSGAVRLALDSQSSFELSYSSHSGELRDGINLTVKRSPKVRRGFSSGTLEGSFGKGEGIIEADAFSGNLTLKKK